MVEEELGGTALIRNSPALPQEIEHHFGRTHRGEEDVEDRQVSQEEVHGRVELGRSQNSEEDE